MPNLWGKMLGGDEDENYGDYIPDPAANLSYASNQTGGVDRQPAGLRAAPPPPQGISPEKQQNVGNMRDVLQKYLNQQEQGVGNMQTLADKYKGQLAERNQQPNRSNLNMLADYYWGTGFSKNYRKPQAPDEETKDLMDAENMVQKQRQPLSQDALKQFAIENSSADKEQGNYFRQLATGVKEKNKNDADERKNIHDFRDSVFFKGRTAPEIRQSIGKLQRGNSAIALMDVLPPEGPTRGEMSNIATSLAGLVGQGNIVTNDKIKEIMPENVDLEVSDLKRWLTSEPKGADQKAFLDRFRREIEVEIKRSRKTLRDYQNGQAASYAGKINEKDLKQILDAAGGFIDHGYYNPEERDKAVNSQISSDPTKPPVPGAKMQENKSGQKAWLMPDGTRIKVPDGK